MNQTLFSLLLGLTLLTAACDKKNDEPKPAPSIEGRWEIQSTNTYSYDADRKLLRYTVDTSAAARYFYTIISKDAILHYDRKNNSLLGGGPITYLNPTTVTYGRTSGTIVIKELTAHRLVLHYLPEKLPVPYPYYEPEDIYVR
ncbi:hypothetical protein [Hymenobacter rigui]|uniref:Lipocalin-like domain-containing protein n=1 Tax=Hymenobacter rigui TaxID=334424 RepID=A0A3R9PDY0_9BACT|nr:hypothetical protein [Hymenobacter rigui]RSK50061.1 hypothetical protein EI291_05265 [Hymenobacter rigui]